MPCEPGVLDVESKAESDLQSRVSDLGCGISSLNPKPETLNSITLARTAGSGHTTHQPPPQLVPGGYVAGTKRAV